MFSTCDVVSSYSVCLVLLQYRYLMYFVLHQRNLREIYCQYLSEIVQSKLFQYNALQTPSFSPAKYDGSSMFIDAFFCGNHLFF